MYYLQYFLTIEEPENINKVAKKNIFMF